MIFGWMKKNEHIEDAPEVAQPQEGEKHSEIMISIDRANGKDEIRIVNAYCKQHRAEMVELRQNNVFCMAVCNVPKTEATTFKTEVQAHLEKFRESGVNIPSSQAENGHVKWV